MIRGAKNPFPAKMKPTTNVFSTPQKMDPPPSELKKARGVAAAAMKSERKHMGGGKSAKAVRQSAYSGAGKRTKIA